MEKGVLTIAAALAISPAALAQSRPDDPLLWYTFEQTRGQVILDLTGQDLFAWSAQRPFLAPIEGFESDAMWFDGESDRVDLPRDALRAVANLTEGSVFVRFTYDGDLLSVQNAIPLVHVGIADTDEIDTFLTIEVGHSSPTNAKLYFTFVIEDVLTLCFDSTFNLRPGEVHSFVGIVGPQGNTGYLDGQVLAGRTYNAGDPTSTTFFADLPREDLDLFSLGYGKAQDKHTADFEYHGGAIHAFRVYDRALTGPEAIALTRIQK